MASIQVDSAVEKDDLFIPLIDFSHFASPTSTPSTRLATARALLSGFQRAGFVYLRNHGIPAADVRAVFAHSAGFFARPQPQKDALAWYSPRANRGYVAHGREKVTRADYAGDVAQLRAAVPDLKESMEIGREGEDGCPNMWPSAEEEAGAAFREVMEAFHGMCKELHRGVMRAVALGMGLEDEGWFDEYTRRGDNTLRLLHYPEVEKSVFEREDGQVQVRAGEHSDYGSLTLLFQDDRGGLQVLSPKGTFVDATPIPDTIVVNAGDLLERWANDTIKSTKHRVVEPPPKPGQESLEKYPARYSVAYFCNPDFDKLIEAIPGTYEEGKQKYPGVLSGDYLAKRLSETYGDLDKYDLKV
ncbi:2og-fe oxygenase family [Diplodia corticola]|uniref:2og-fe oxygenase family n=1 Tax=Diplodia corticola TaxID=236234 RepID=A0A1J9RPU6_9PEZI|nr:2og-fe oxygenase family [Diplodia corticola]OJD30487.1 2og-fe oxygenase family [Diplodia corticola]